MIVGYECVLPQPDSAASEIGAGLAVGAAQDAPSRVRSLSFLAGAGDNPSKSARK